MSLFQTTVSQRQVKHVDRIPRGTCWTMHAHSNRVSRCRRITVQTCMNAYFLITKVNANITNLLVVCNGSSDSTNQMCTKFLFSFSVRVSQCDWLKVITFTQWCKFMHIWFIIIRSFETSTIFLFISLFIRCVACDL